MENAMVRQDADVLEGRGQGLVVGRSHGWRALVRVVDEAATSTREPEAAHGQSDSQRA